MLLAGIDLYAMKNSPFIFKATDLRELIGKLGKENFASVFKGLGDFGAERDLTWSGEVSGVGGVGGALSGKPEEVERMRVGD